NVRATFRNDAEVLSYTDYYPHGGILPTRSYQSSELYRYDYQGQEKDVETKWNNFDLRMYDADLGQWLSPDPMGQHFSPYLAMSNNPVSFIDPTGGEDLTDFGLSAAYSNYYDYYEDLLFMSWAGSADDDYARMIRTERDIEDRKYEKLYNLS